MASKSLRRINELIANADPNNYDSISYGKYYRDLTSISNHILEEDAEKHAKEKALLLEIHKLEDSEVKTRLLTLIK
jgi:hypothetical protein